MKNNQFFDSITNDEFDIESFFLEEELQGQLEVAASLATFSTLGSATGCASTLGTVSCWG